MKVTVNVILGVNEKVEAIQEAMAGRIKAENLNVRLIPPYFNRRYFRRTAQWY